MKILIALHDYLPLHKGGSEVHAHQSGAELARRRHTTLDTRTPPHTRPVPLIKYRLVKGNRQAVVTQPLSRQPE